MTQNVRNGGIGTDFMLPSAGKDKKADSSGMDFESFLSPGMGSITRKADGAGRRSDLSAIGSSQTARNQTKSRTENRSAERSQENPTENGTKKAESSSDSVTKQNTVEEPGQKPEQVQEEQGVSDATEGIDEASQEEAMEALVTSVLEFLNGIAKDVVAVDPGAIQDWMQEHGMSLSDMLNPDNLKQMVLDLNGLSDPAGFLTNGEALAEWNEIQARLAELLAANETAVEDLQQMEVSGELGQMDAPIEADFMQDEAGEPELLLYKAEPSEGVEGTRAEGQETDADTQTASRSDVQSNERQSVRAGENGQESLANVFLNQMHEALGNAVEALDANVRVTQTEILDQVMNQIRVGISQEVTSMDFMLHPETLGRVHVSVLAKEGVMTAQFTVQSEEAKQALESQLVTLRQTFEDQGLKVESVEVNVSEFAFGEESQGSGQTKEDGNGSSRRNKRFDYGAAIDPAEETAGMEELSPTEMSLLEAQNMEISGVQVDYSA